MPRPGVILYVGALGGIFSAALFCAADAQEAAPSSNAPTETARSGDDAGKPKDAQDLGKDVSGVFVNSPVPQGGYAPDFMFRGFDNGGLILRDGAARGFFSGNVELAGVERTEFVKGVTSILYGAETSAMGAAANYITKKPLPDFFLQDDATVGAFGFRRTTIDLNRPLNDDKNLLFRLNVAAQDSKSVVDYVRSESLYVNPVMALTLDNGDRLTLRGESNASDQILNYGLPTYIASPIFLTLPRSFYGAVSANEDIWSDRSDIALRYEHAFDKNWSATIIVDYYRGFTSLGWFTGWTYDGLGDIAFGDGVRTHDYGKVFDAQAILKGKLETAALTHNLFFGYERWSFDDRHRDEITAYPIPPINIFAPLYPSFVSYAFAQRASGVDSNWSNSAFAHDLVDIGPQWRVLAGGRYDYLASYETLIDPTGALTGTPGSSASKGFDPKLTPRLGLLYRPMDNLSIHAAYGRSFIPNNGVRIAGGTLAPPEEDRLYELGLRHNLLDRKIDIDLGVFDVTRDNVAALNPLNPSGFDR